MSGSDPVRVLPGTRLRAIIGTEQMASEYFCNYGVNEEYEARLQAAGLRVSARGPSGEVRAVELPVHRFFIATLFQPQLSSTAENPHLLVLAYLRACAKFRANRSPVTREKKRASAKA